MSPPLPPPPPPPPTPPPQTPKPPPPPPQTPPFSGAGDSFPPTLPLPFLLILFPFVFFYPANGPPLLPLFVLLGSLVADIPHPTLATSSKTLVLRSSTPWSHFFSAQPQATPSYFWAERELPSQYACPPFETKRPGLSPFFWRPFFPREPACPDRSRSLFPNFSLDRGWNRRPLVL